MIRGTAVQMPGPGWSKTESSRFGEDLVGGWLLKNGGLEEGLQKAKRIPIPEGGTLPIRTVDWLLGNRIAVEVKTYLHVLTKGYYLKVTRQFNDYSLWRDEAPSERAVVLARVAWNGNSRIEELFWEDLRHFRIPVIFLHWGEQSAR